MRPLLHWPLASLLSWESFPISPGDGDSNRYNGLIWIIQCLLGISGFSGDTLTFMLDFFTSQIINERGFTLLAALAFGPISFLTLSS